MLGEMRREEDMTEKQSVNEVEYEERETMEKPEKVLQQLSVTGK